jgi:hypothetical protein
MTAPLSPAQAEHLARIEAAPDAEESLRERVARAMCGQPASVHWRPRRVHGDAGGYYGLNLDAARRLADAAIAVICTPATDAPAGWSAAHEWQCPSCGATTRARMADHAAPAAAADTQGGGR